MLANEVDGLMRCSHIRPKGKRGTQAAGVIMAHREPGVQWRTAVRARSPSALLGGENRRRQVPPANGTMPMRGASARGGV